MMNLNRLKWGAAIVVCAFLLAFEYARHFVWPALLHQFPLYVASIVLVFIGIMIFNQFVFGLIYKAQRATAEQTRYLNLLIESSGNAIITTSIDGQILSWNRAAEDIYGWPKTEAVGKMLPMVPPETRIEAMSIIERLKAGETIRNIETIRMRRDGARIPVMLTASPIRDEAGSVIGVMGISTDLRERQRLERELLAQQRSTAVLQERERLARELHDDIGQVLGYINTQSQAVSALFEQRQPEAAATLALRLTEVAQEAHGNVRNYILGLQTSINVEGGVVPALLTYAERFGRSNGLLVDASATPEARSLDVKPAAAAQLMRVAQEALTNVRKHACAKQVRVSAEAADGCIRLRIEDDGRGFDVAALAREAETHFGQRIMRERMADVGGTVTVDSAPGKGTRVVITAPRRAKA